MAEVISAFRTTLVEFCEAASWITRQSAQWEHATVQNKIEALTPIAEKYERSFKNSQLQIDQELGLMLENNASNLWNSLVVMIRAEKTGKKYHLLCKCQYFAAVLLSLNDSLLPNDSKKLRNFKCFITIMDNLVDTEFKELFIQNQHHADTLLTILEPRKQPECVKLVMEWYILNFQFCIKENDFNTAKIYMSKIDISNKLDAIDATFLLNICRVIYNTAVDLKSGDNCEVAIPLLTKTRSLLQLSVTNLKMHPEYANLRYSTMLLLADCLGNQYRQDSKYATDCQECLDFLQQEYPSKIEPFLLAINFYKNSNKEHDVIQETLMRMIMSVNVQSSFDSIIGCINEYAQININLALTSMDYFFLNKLDPSVDQAYLEKVIISRFFVTTQSQLLTDAEILESLKNFVQNVERKLTSPISGKTISSITTLLWNSGKKLEKKKAYKESSQFFELILSKILDNSYHDKAKVQRALINAYIANDEFECARNVVDAMEKKDENSPLTQFLIFKIHLEQKEYEKAKHCLEMIQSSDHINSMEILILAASECKKIGSLAIYSTTQIFNKLAKFESLESQTASDICPPLLALVRYTLQFILKMIEDEGDGCMHKYMGTIKALLSKSYEFLNKARIMQSLQNNKSNIVSIDEIEWLASTSYNLSIKFMDLARIADTLDIASMSGKFIELIPAQDFTFPKMFHYKYWAIRSSILFVTLSTRAFPDDKNLHKMRARSAAIVSDIQAKKESQEYEDGCSAEQVKLLRECLIDSISLQLHTNLLLRDRTAILDILAQTEADKGLDIESCLVNTVMTNEDLPKGLVLEVLSKLVARNLANQEIPDSTIILWETVILETSLEINRPIPLFTIEAIQIRLKSNEEPKGPEFELVATLCWNQGVNLIMEEDYTQGTAWCKKSIELATLTNRSLAEKLSEMWVSLAESAKMEVASMDDV